MTDVHSIEIRSKNMSAIRSSGNRSTEKRFLDILKSSHITGWRRHNKKIFGRPDFSFQQVKLAVFLDGCFWHGCTVCYKTPLTNPEFWDTKIERNKQRDAHVNQLLSKKGWQVLRIWEHELKLNPNETLDKLLSKF